MCLNEIKKKLDKLNFTYSCKDRTLEIKLGFGLIAEVQQNNTSISVSGILTPWNPISGLFRVDIEKSLVYNSISLIIFYILLFLMILDDFKLNSFLLIFAGLICVHLILWYILFLVKYYSFRSQIQQWIIMDH